MKSPIEATAAANARYTEAVMNRAADIIEDLSARGLDWSAETALETAGQEIRDRNRRDLNALRFTGRAVINTLNQHLESASEPEPRKGKGPYAALESMGGGRSAKAAEILRETASELAKEVHQSSIRTEEVLEKLWKLELTEEDVLEELRKVRADARQRQKQDRAQAGPQCSGTTAESS